MPHKVVKNPLQIFWCSLKLKALILYKLIGAIIPILVFIYNPYCRRTIAIENLLVIAFHPTYYFSGFKNCFHARQIIVDYGSDNYESISNALNSFVALAWLCEKMKIDIKIKHPSNMVWRHFENHTITNAIEKQKKEFIEPKKHYFPAYPLARYGLFSNSSEYGYKILSKLSIKEDLKKSANQWCEKYIKGSWVAVHYRGTDIATVKGYLKTQYRVSLDSYITYLKEVLNDQRNIFICSDQAQFIDKMHEAFPGRIVTRNIQRSHDDTTLHAHGHYQNIDNFSQEKDALIDILILAKAKLIYASGSGFADIVRYFNPKVKIVALDGRGRGRASGNVLPIPKKDLFNKLRIK